MKTFIMRIRKTLLPSIAFVLLAISSPAQQSLSEQINQFVNEKYRASDPGAAVLVAMNEKVIFRRGYGMASLNPAVSNRADMVFRIGSITKQFTSTAILQLVEQGKIELNADITKYLTGFSTSGKTITVEQLLNHTSGIKSYTSVPDVMSKDKKGKSISVDEMLKIIQSHPPDFAPNDQWLYNNSGYFLLGAIIEKVSGMSYGAYVSKNLFKPVGMKSSFADDTKLPANRAVGHQKTNASEYTVSDYVHPSIPYSAGAIFSTLDDLWKWNQAVFNYKLLKKETLERAWKPAKLNNGQLISYGYGWQLGRLGDSPVIGHGGAIDGFLTSEIYVPDHKIYVCILSNNMTVAPDEYAYQIAEIVSGIKKEVPSTISLEESVAIEYAGVYQINEKEDRIITRKENQFFSQRTGGTKFEIFPYAKDAFYFKDSSSKLSFIRSSQGKIEAVEMKGREYILQVAKRTDKMPPSDHVQIELDSTIFDHYAGEYELAPGFIIKVWRDAMTFRAQATGQPFFEIFAESKTKFFLKVVDAQLEFFKDENGNTSSLTLFQGGRQMLGKKIK